MNEQQLLVGDDAIHGEEAYALFFEGERSHLSLNTNALESGHIIDSQSMGNAEGSGHGTPSGSTTNGTKKD